MLAADLGEPHVIADLAATVLARFGRCDILVNNAAFMPMTTLETISSDIRRRVQSVNVEALANELGKAGITVNAIAPTVVKTEGFSDRLSDGGPTPEQVMDRIVSQQTIPRAWLVTDDAGFVTGQIVHVDGGRTRSGA